MSIEPFARKKRWHSGGRLYEYNGELLRVSDIAFLTGIPAGTLRARLAHGLPPEDAFKDIDYRASEFKPKIVHKKKLYDYHGEALTKKEICEREGITLDGLNYRIYTKKLFERVDK